MRAGIINRIMHDERRRRQQIERTPEAQNHFDKVTEHVVADEVPVVPVNKEDG